MFICVCVIYITTQKYIHIHKHIHNFFLSVCIYRYKIFKYLCYYVEECHADLRQGRAYRDLLDLSCVCDDLLHHLHGLSSAALGLLGLTLRLGLDNLHLLTFSNLHGHWGGLERVMRKLIESGSESVGLPRG